MINRAATLDLADTYLKVIAAGAANQLASFSQDEIFNKVGKSNEISGASANTNFKPQGLEPLETW